MFILGGGVHPPQGFVAVGEPAEARDDVSMMRGIAREPFNELPPRGRNRIDQRIDLVDIALLLGERLAVVEGMEEEDAPRWRQGLVEAARDGAFRGGDGADIVLERTPGAAVAMPRELVEEDHQGQGPFAGRLPVAEFSASGRVERGAEAAPDQVIEGVAGAIPEVPALVRGLRTRPGVLEPEAQDVAGRNRRRSFALGQR